MCLTGIKVGAAGGAAAPAPFVSVFAADLATLAAARLACLAERCQLPTAGTKAVRLEVPSPAIACVCWPCSLHVAPVCALQALQTSAVYAHTL